MSKDADKQRQADLETPDEPDGGFYRRWSRRKQAARQDDLPEAAAETVAPAPSEPELPPLEALDEYSDYSGFLSDKVSDRLRKQALRKLFHLPQFNITDGLDDYDEDFSIFEPLGDILTADMRHRAEQESRRQESPAADEPLTPAEPEVAEADDAQQPEATITENQAADAPPNDPDDEPLPPV